MKVAAMTLAPLEASQQDFCRFDRDQRNQAASLPQLEVM
jgi:hypothetical protein